MSKPYLIDFKRTTEQVLSWSIYYFIYAQLNDSANLFGVEHTVQWRQYAVAKSKQKPPKHQ
jgi:hypothetical protein